MVHEGLVGTWRVRRRIVDHLTGRTALFEGVATVTVTRFTEAGLLRTGHQDLDASRDYVLRDDGAALLIRFPNGAPFVRLEARPDQHLDHLCGDDHYRGRLLVTSPARWMEIWRVTGPRKRYVSVSRNERLPTA